MEKKLFIAGIVFIVIVGIAIYFLVRARNKNNEHYDKVYPASGFVRPTEVNKDFTVIDIRNTPDAAGNVIPVIQFDPTLRRSR